MTGWHQSVSHWPLAVSVCVCLWVWLRCVNEASVSGHRAETTGSARNAFAWALSNNRRLIGYWIFPDSEIRGRLAVYAHTSSTFEKLTKKKRKGIQGIMLRYITAVVFQFFFSFFLGLLTGWRRRQHLCFLIILSLIYFLFLSFLHIVFHTV